MSGSASRGAPREISPPGRSGAFAVIAIIVGLVALAIWLMRADDGPVPPFLGGPRPEAPPPTLEAAVDLLDVAGSGSNLPITRALAAALPAELVEQPVIHDSIGSGGGVRALLDDAVDLALVSRPLAPTERELGLVEFPYARVPVVFAVNASVGEVSVDGDDVLAIFSGERKTWSDGTPIVVLMRERGDSSHRAVAAKLPGFAEVCERAWEAATFRVLYHDDDMREAIAATPGAIGLFGQGAIPRGVPIRGLRVDGVVPTVEAMVSGDYPYAKELQFVSRGPPRGPAARLVTFSHSTVGQEIVRQMGALPIGESVR